MPYGCVQKNPAAMANSEDPYQTTTPLSASHIFPAKIQCVIINTGNNLNINEKLT